MLFKIRTRIAVWFLLLIVCLAPFNQGSGQTPAQDRLRVDSSRTSPSIQAGIVLLDSLSTPPHHRPITNAIVIPAVVIYSPLAFRYVVGQKKIYPFPGNPQLSLKQLDAYTSDDLGRLLSQLGPVFVRDYGSGGLASPGLRGTGAQHTAVLWEGIQLQSPLNGQVDLSLLPLGLNQLSGLSMGAGSALFGSGAIGGTVHLSSGSPGNNMIEAGFRQQAGSFGQMTSTGRLGYRVNKTFVQAKGFYRRANNDFPFQHPYLPGTPEVRQEHAALEQWGVLVEPHIQIEKGGTLDLIGWYQESKRELPPTLVQTSSSATQDDREMRVLGKWSKELSLNSYSQISAAWQRAELDFRDPNISLDSRSGSDLLTFRGVLIQKLGYHHLLDVGAEHIHARGRADNFTNTAVQNRTALFAAFKNTQARKLLQYTASVRQELMDGELLPITPSAGLEIKLEQSVFLRRRIRFHAARHYRVPTLNDRFWVPGGNPDLQAESGWTQEVGFHYDWGYDSRSSPGKGKISLDFSVFNNVIENWILWQPSVNGNFWEANNVLKVHARGMEAEAGCIVPFSSLWEVELGLGWQWNRSTVQDDGTANSNQIGKQLIYVPEHRGQLNFRLNYDRHQLWYLHQVSGIRYTTSSNSQSLPAFQTGSVGISTKWPIKEKFLLTAGGRVENLWDEVYQVLENRPQPGRHFLLNLALDFGLR